MFSKEFRTAAPFYRLQASQRSASETALNNPKRPTGGLSGAQTGSMSVLNTRRDSDFGSNTSLPNASRGPTKSHSTRPTSAFTTDRSSKGKHARSQSPESVSASSDSED